jgi:hypothetical protein
MKEFRFRVFENKAVMRLLRPEFNSFVFVA